MPVHGPLVQLLWGIGALGAGVLAVVGGLGLRGPGLVAVVVAGTLAACIAVGIDRDDPGHDRRSVLESAVQASCWTVGVLLVLAGIAALAGALTAFLAGAGGLAVWLIAHLARSGRRTTPGGQVLRMPVRATDEAAVAPQDASSPLSALTTAALGQEWLLTTTALGGGLTPADRQALVRRREETLDELERRDPVGFARWLADGSVAGSDPAAYVRGRPVQEDPTAGTDAA